MASLAAASEARSAHELAAHGYQHVSAPLEMRRSWAQQSTKRPTR